MENIPIGIFASSALVASGISFVSATPIQTFSGGSLSVPANLQTGDMLIILTASDSSLPAIPAGYTSMYLGGSSIRYMAAYKFMGATVDTQISGLTNNTTTTHMAFAFRGVSQTSPVALGNVNTTTTTPTPGSVTITNAPNNNARIISLGFLDDDRVAATVTPPINQTLISAAQSSGTGATVMASLHTSLFGNATYSLNGASFGIAGNVDDTASMLVALNPA
jgi:hypothetical protein